MKKYLQHPIGQKVPKMAAQEYQDLRADIKANGLQNDIILFEGMILDGWNRYNACLEEKVYARFKEYEGDRPVAYVTSTLKRRHLTTSQLAAFAAEIAESYAEESRQRMVSGKKTETDEKGKSTSKAAAAVGVSVSTVAAAAKVKKEKPIQFEQIKEGKITVHAASLPTESEHDKAIKRIGKILGISFSQAVLKGTLLKSPKEVIKMASLEDDDMLRIQLLVQQGWEVAKALKFKAVSITKGHKVKDLLDRAAANGGKFDLNIDQWTIQVRKY